MGETNAIVEPIGNTAAIKTAAFPNLGLMLALIQNTAISKFELLTLSFPLSYAGMVELVSRRSMD